LLIVLSDDVTKDSPSLEDDIVIHYWFVISDRDPGASDGIVGLRGNTLAYHGGPGRMQAARDLLGGRDKEHELSGRIAPNRESPVRIDFREKVWSHAKRGDFSRGQGENA